MKRVFIYRYTSTDGFVEYFQTLAQQERPWIGEKVWETLEGELKLGATCDALGHVRYNVTLRDQDLGWSVGCILLSDLGMLSQHSRDAKNFMMS